MLLKQQNEYTGMSKDMSSNKQSNKYFDAKNIRVVATDQKSTFALTNEAGNEKILSIPIPEVNIAETSIKYEVNLEEGNSTLKELVYFTKNTDVSHIVTSYSGRTSLTQTIIGVKELRDSAIIITTDNNGFDCFWELLNLNNDNFDLNLLYMGNLGLSSDNLIQILYNYENSIIQKIYFADGVNQLRFFNIRQSTVNGDSINLIDLNPSAIDVVSEFNLSQPSISLSSGGSHTSGMIQHAYNLYILNGSQTTISPLSELIPIGKENGLGGGEVNEVLGKSINIKIANVDNRFTHVKIYSIKYTSYNENPEITIVADKEIDDFNTFSFTDIGRSGTTISIDAFIFLGSNPIIPRHIVTKDNRLFPVNITERSFDVDLDCRALSFNSSSVVKIGSNLYYDENDNQRGVYNSGNFSDIFVENSKFDSINPDYESYKYKSDGSTYGGSGKYVDVEIFRNSNLSDDDVSKFKFFKDNEIYRLGIKFYNRLGQESFPKWIMDFVAPMGNLEGNYNQLRVTLTADFYTWLNDSSNFDDINDKPVGYKILRADRTLSDQTIHSQGIINPMVANVILTGQDINTQASVNNFLQKTSTTLIPSVIRMFKDEIPFRRCKHSMPLDWSSFRDFSFANNPQDKVYRGYRWAETPRVAATSDRRARNYQYNSLMQFFSPEILFRDNKIDASYELRVRGLAEQDDVANWGQEVNPISRATVAEVIYNDSILFAKQNQNKTDFLPVEESTYNKIKGNADWIGDLGFFGPPTKDKNYHAEMQMYRSFNGDFHKTSRSRDNTYKPFGTPELTQEGADFTTYNNQPNLKYSNNLKSMLVDRFNDSRDFKKWDRQIRGNNSIGSKCITFMLGAEAGNLPFRKKIEELHEDTGISETNGVLIAEFVQNKKNLYVGFIYGGMTYASKKNTSYIEIGEYNHIDTNNVLIDSPGDTFVGNFTFAKLAKTPTENTSTEFNTVSEIVSVRIETTVDLKNRNDLSLGVWNAKYQPHYADYNKYNKVYSQQPNLIKSVGLSSKFKKLEEFDGRLMSSKEKIPGEFVDSWTDFLENETMDLDGKYGPINAVVSLQDEIFCLQDTGVAQIAVNPRAQVQAKDGISLELGVGGILHDYKYLSTTTGCLNKWGIVSSESAFYFVDVINRGIMTFDGRAVGRISDLKGFHHEFLNKFNYEDIRNDNSVSGTGLSAGYNPVNSDVYFSFHQSEGNDSFTIRFSEKTGEFMSYVDYVPSWYINKGSVLITTNSDNDQVWEHFKGKPNHFYGVHYPSSITFHSAPKGNEIIMNGASFAMELTDSTGAEVLNKGLTGVRVYNDYQDSEMVDLELRKNIWKKFRNWKLNFPRDKGTRDRVRSMWAFTEFEFNNPEGNKLILHDITLFYTQH